MASRWRPAGLESTWVTAAGWAVALMVSGALVTRRFLSATGVPGNGYDLWHCFVPAARAVATGGNPYDVACYVYPPLVAVALAPVSDRDSIHVWWTAGNLVCAIVAVAVIVWTRRRGLPAWRAPVLVAFAMITLLWTWPITREFHIGGTNLMLLMLLSLAGVAGRGSRAGLSGGLLAPAALIKTWPGAMVCGCCGGRPGDEPGEWVSPSRWA